MMTVKTAPNDVEIYLAKDSNDWKAKPISHSRESVHIMKMTVLYPFVDTAQYIVLTGFIPRVTTVWYP